ncbi:Dolichyl-phosphate-mannose--protein mannosyltransferase 2 [Rhodotorula toruloides]
MSFRRPRSPSRPLLSTRSQSPSPPPTPDAEDPYAPRQPGLPLYTARKNSHTKDRQDMVEVVDSSTARRRVPGQSPAVLFDASGAEGGDGQGTVDEYDADVEGTQGFARARRDSRSDKGEKDVWPVSGIGMEGRIPETRQEFLQKGGKARARGEPVSWRAIGREVVSDLRAQIPLIIYTILSLFTRLYRIGANNTVVWDEAHFGKFGAYYLNRTFYFDVHPPLGKMLVGLAGALSGFNGSFDYPSGAVYPDHVPFHAMRIMLALPGVAMVPLAWGTAVELRMTKWGRHIVTLMVLTDLAWLAISRFVLLDSLLLFFTFTTVYCLACFNNQQRRPFEEDWWIWLTLTGISIGCVCSVKWVGMFVTALVGLYTVEDLWNKFGDLRMSFRTYARHWVARILCLIVIPFFVYALTFKIHFLILNHSGPGDSQMSSLFQAHLHGNDFAQNPLEPAFGSRITLKNMGYGGGLLHSHVQTYPVGSQQQQVTCYHYKDENNDWVLTPTWEADPIDLENGEIVFLRHGDQLRLVHASTGRNLHSHAIAAPVTKLANEVSCYGNATVGDSNDYWVVEVVDDFLRGARHKFDRIHSLSTRLRFKHLNSGCYLRAANAVLPQWGFKQVEVSCDKENNPKDEHTYWNIESHWNERLPTGNQKLYRSPFFRDFWHLNVAMMTSNNALVPDADKEDTIASKPFEWPFLWNGMRMNGWQDFGIKYYLIGNPATWWLSSASLIVWAFTLLWHLMRFQRKINDFAPGEWNHFLYLSKIAFGGWFFHYFPFLIMGRVTYLHHYLPTLWFSVLMAGVLLDHFFFRSRRLTGRTKTLVFAIVAGAVVGTWWWFRACAWGIHGPASNLWGRKWRKTWNIYD